MEAFPAFLPLSGRLVVIAGFGEAADAKARLLQSSPATLVRLREPEAFSAAAYADAVMVFIASDDAAFRLAASRAARAAGRLVNVVDHPGESDFYTPALIDRGQVVIAIGTDGASPMLASMLRSDIEVLIPEGTGRVASLLRQHQDEIRAALPKPHQRRAFLRDALTSPAARAAEDGDATAASSLFLEALAKGLTHEGSVRFVDGRGPVDLLTLRAARVLAAADVLIADAAADPQVIALSRRDAEREVPTGTERLIALAQSGQRVVRVINQPPPSAVLEGLQAAGVTVEVIPTAEDGCGWLTLPT